MTKRSFKKTQKTHKQSLRDGLYTPQATVDCGLSTAALSNLIQRKPLLGLVREDVSIPRAITPSEIDQK
jgi:hypothetical protein